jgi:hypothetical protein
MMGTIGILNVGAGDTKLTFDKNNPAECIRSARIVTDMLRRGYALLVEVPGKRGQPKTYARVHEFKADTCEYVIADFDPVEAAKVDETENAQGEQGQEAAANPATAAAATPKLRGRPRKTVPATGTSGVAVARSAGG